MHDTTDLISDQAHRFATIDPLLPGVTGPPEGRALTATVADGGRVTAVLRLDVGTDPSAWEAPWPAERAWELAPLLGFHGREGMDAVLRAYRAWLDREPPGSDSACRIVWPSRDAECTRPLLDHGFVPVGALGVRTGLSSGDPGGHEGGAPPGPPSGGPATTPTVRAARPGDLEALLNLATGKPAHSGGVVGSPHSPGRPRPGVCRGRRGGLRERLVNGTPSTARIWLAELDGAAVGMVGSDWADLPEPGGRAGGPAALLPRGRWGHLSGAVVRPDVRGRGVGRALAAAAHAELARVGAGGSSVGYDPLDPLAAVFWHRRGYRPLWTVWEIRPATRLR